MPLNKPFDPLDPATLRRIPQDSEIGRELTTVLVDLAVDDTTQTLHGFAADETRSACSQELASLRRVQGDLLELVVDFPAHTLCRSCRLPVNWSLEDRISPTIRAFLDIGRVLTGRLFDGSTLDFGAESPDTHLLARMATVDGLEAFERDVTEYFARDLGIGEAVSPVADELIAMSEAANCLRTVVTYEEATERQHRAVTDDQLATLAEALKGSTSDLLRSTLAELTHSRSQREIDPALTRIAGQAFERWRSGTGPVLQAETAGYRLETTWTAAGTVLPARALEAMSFANGSAVVVSRPLDLIGTCDFRALPDEPVLRSRVVETCRVLTESMTAFEALDAAMRLEA